jgi:hypothetical protein
MPIAIVTPQSGAPIAPKLIREFEYNFMVLCPFLNYLTSGLRRTKFFDLPREGNSVATANKSFGIKYSRMREKIRHVVLTWKATERSEVFAGATENCSPFFILRWLVSETTVDSALTRSLISILSLSEDVIFS